VGGTADESSAGKKTSSHGKGFLFSIAKGYPWEKGHNRSKDEKRDQSPKPLGLTGNGQGRKDLGRKEELQYENVRKKTFYTAPEGGRNSPNASKKNRVFWGEMGGQSPSAQNK